MNGPIIYQSYEFSQVCPQVTVSRGALKMIFQVTWEVIDVPAVKEKVAIRRVAHGGHVTR